MNNNEYINRLKEELPDKIYKSRDLEIEKCIGECAFGKYFLAKHLPTNNFYMVKKFYKNSAQSDIFRRFNLEIRTLSRCNSVCVQKLVGFTAFSPYSVITEYYPNRSIDTFLYSINESRKRCIIGTPQSKIATGVAWGLMHIHSRGIIHRDLRVENVFLDKNFVPKVANFGIANFLDNYQNLTKVIGFTQYLVPEVGLGHDYGVQAEMYSFGMFLYEMYEMKKPFMGYSAKQILNQVIKGGERPKFSNEIPENLQKFIEKCWDADPDKRPTIEEAFDLFSTGKLAFPGTDHQEILDFVEFLKDNDDEPETIDNFELEAHEFLKTNCQDILSSGISKTIEEIVEEEQDQYQELKPENKIEIQEYEGISTEDFIRLMSEFRDADINNLMQISPPLINIILNSLDYEKINLILKTAVELIHKNNEFIFYLDAAGFYTSYQIISSEIADNLIELYSFAFALLPQMLTENHAYFIAQLLNLRPEKVLSLFSHYLLNFESIENPWPVLDLLVTNYHKVINEDYGDNLLKLLFYLVVSFKPYCDGRFQYVIQTYLDFLKSNNERTLKSAYKGLICLVADQMTEINIDQIVQHLDSDIYDYVISFLLRLPINIYQEHLAVIVDDIISHCGDYKYTWVLLLKISKFDQNLHFFIENTSWMQYSDSFPSESMKLFISIFREPEYRQLLAESEFFCDFMKGVIQYSSAENYNALDSIITRIKLNKLIMKQIHQNGFIEQFIDQSVACSSHEMHKTCLICLDSFSRIDYFPEYLNFIPVLMTHLKSPDLYGYAVHVIVSLSYHCEIARIFVKKGFINYFITLKSVREYAEISDIFLSNARLAMR